MVERIHNPESSLKELILREHETLRYIVLGYSNPEIAVCLSLSVKTIGWHRMNLMRKLGIHKVADMVRYALRKDLLDSTELCE